MTLHPVDDTQPEPTDPAPSEELSLLRVEAATLAKPDAVASKSYLLTFNRPLTWWEEREAAYQGLTATAGSAAVVVTRSLSGNDALQWVMNLADQIEVNARKTRDRFAQDAEDLKTDADRINLFLARRRGDA